MNIVMAGIDHQHAGLREREPFAFTPNALRQALERTAKACPQTGCVIISTCNRTEIWVSAEAGPDPEQLLCDLRGLPLPENRELFQRREGTDAAAHLFLLAGGLKSQILGENQILAQVKEAREIARQAGSIDSVLDRLFQMAIACAKRIKTETGITRANPSTAAAAADYAVSRHPQPEGLRCLVIGNGAVGRQTAELLSRLDRAIRSLNLDSDSGNRLRLALAHASRMVTGKMLFGLRETLESSVWALCFRAPGEAAGIKPEEALGREGSRG